MRNNNIIIVKCFISSFAGKRIHQSSRGGWVEAGGEEGTWHEGTVWWFGGCYCLYLTADDWRWLSGIQKLNSAINRWRGAVQLTNWVWAFIGPIFCQFFWGVMMKICQKYGQVMKWNMPPSLQSLVSLVKDIWGLGIKLKMKLARVQPILCQG